MLDALLWCDFFPLCIKAANKSNLVISGCWLISRRVWYDRLTFTIWWHLLLPLCVMHTQLECTVDFVKHWWEKREYYHSYIIAMVIAIYVCGACDHISHNNTTHHITPLTHSKISNHIMARHNRSYQSQEEKMKKKMMLMKNKSKSKNETCEWHMGVVSVSGCVYCISFCIDHTSIRITIYYHM